MKKSIRFSWQGCILIALSFCLSGCEYLTENYYTIESGCECEAVADCACQPAGGGECGSMQGCDCQPSEGCMCQPSIGCMCEPADCGGDEDQAPEITGFTFTPTAPIRTFYAKGNFIAGRFNAPVGGVAPFIYSLAASNGITDADNSRFFIENDSLIVGYVAPLDPGIYHVYLGIIDSNGKSFNQPAIITVIPDPVSLDQEIRTVWGVDFKMIYVPNEHFTKPVSYYTSNTTVYYGFFIAETEVTQELYQVVMGNNPSRFQGSRRPVESVSWIEAVLFCNRLSVMTGREPYYIVRESSDWETYLSGIISSKTSFITNDVYFDQTANGYRLPSSDEWIYAAAGAVISPGQTNTTGASKFYSGSLDHTSNGIEEFAWYNRNSNGMTHEVALKRSNEIGLFDMTGNVSEITWDPIWDIVMGTHWNSSTEYQLYQSIGNNYKHEGFDWLGFRIVSNQ